VHFDIFGTQTLYLCLCYDIMVYRIAERREHAKQLLTYIATDDMKVNVIKDNGFKDNGLVELKLHFQTTVVDRS